MDRSKAAKSGFSIFLFHLYLSGVVNGQRPPVHIIVGGRGVESVYGAGELRESGRVKGKVKGYSN